MTEVELPFRSEYAKSGRSSCKACKTNIEKAQLRLAAMVQVILKYIHPISINFNYYKNTHFDGRLVLLMIQISLICSRLCLTEKFLIGSTQNVSSHEIGLKL